MCTGHNIQECEDFKKLLQAMMKREEIEFFKKVPKESINVITDAKFMGEYSFEGSKHLAIFFEDDLVSKSNITMH